MDSDVIATHLEHLDHRLTRVEQFLPTVAPLATKEDLSESQRGDIRLLAEHLSGVMSRLNDR
jgi:hypothetical protein